MKLNIKIVSLLLTYSLSSKANDALFTNEDETYTQDKVSNLMMEPTPTITSNVPTITKSSNEPEETETTMIYTYGEYINGEYSFGFNYLTTSLPKDVDSASISCSTKDSPKTTDLYCDPHMTCYKSYDTFNTVYEIYEGDVNHDLYCDILIHEKNDPIPPTRPTGYITPCINPKVVTTTRYDSTLLYTSNYNYLPVTSGTVEYTLMNQYVYSISTELVPSVTCTYKDYKTSTFVYPSETLLSFKAPIFEGESLGGKNKNVFGYDSRNFILSKKDVESGSQLEGYCEEVENPNYVVFTMVPRSTTNRITKVPLTGVKTTTNTFSKVPLTGVKTTTNTVSKVLLTGVETTTKNTSKIPSSTKIISSPAKAPISITTAAPKKPATVITSVKTIPVSSISSNNNIALEKRAKSLYYSPSVPHYCRSDGKCFGIYTSYNFGEYNKYYTNCYVFTQEPSPTKSVPITDFCKLTSSLKTSYYTNQKYSSKTIINGDILTHQNYMLDSSLYIHTQTIYGCASTTISSSEEPMITSTESIATSVVETMSTEMVESSVIEIEPTVTVDNFETTNCMPIIVTVTEKDKVTVVQRETVTVTVTE